MKRFHRGLTVLEAIGVLAVLAAILLLFFPLYRGGGREAARRNQCWNNLKWIGIGLQDYEKTHGSYPPAYTVDAGGNRLHSWRTLLLPYLEENELYESLDLSKPWDDPANLAAFGENTPMAYYCPSANHDEGLTTYLAVVGEGFFFSGSQGTAAADIQDGTAKTVTIIDVATNDAIRWMSPEDADESLVLSYDSESKMHHPGVLLASFADGHTESIEVATSSETLPQMLTIAGGEDVAQFGE